MRPWELAIALAAFVAVAWPAISGSRSKRGLVFVAALVSITLQLLLEGFRWQMAPLYLVVLALGLGDLGSMDRELPFWRRVSRPALGLVGVAMMTLPPAALPIPRLPPLSGDRPVGTATFTVEFPERLERYGPAPETVARRLVVQVWYPAEEDGDEPGPWNPDLDLVGPLVSRRLGFPGFFVAHTVYSEGSARPRATPLPGRFPVIIYSHDYADFRTVALNQLEALASRGYFVVAPDHSYASLAARLPDGTEFELDPAALPSDLDQEATIETGRDLEEVMKDDLVGIIDQLGLGELGAFGNWGTHADVARVGAFGRGLGGGAATWFCLTDQRCRGAAGFNPWVEPLPDRVAAEPTTLPMMFLRSIEAQGTNNDGRLRGLAERSEGTAYWISVEGAEGNDFVIAPLFSPIGERLGMKGPIAADRIVAIIDRFLAGFFDHTLVGAGPAAIERNPFPEVSLEIVG